MMSKPTPICPKPMKRLLLLTALLLAGLLATAQRIPTAPNKTDEAGLRQGKWVVLFNDDDEEVEHAYDARYYRVLKYKDDQPDGEIEHYHINGQLYYKGALASDRPDVFDGFYKVYYPDGKLKYEESFAPDPDNEGESLLHGPYKHFWQTGQLREEGRYDMSQATGTWQYYNSQGQLIKKRTYDPNNLPKDIALNDSISLALDQGAFQNALAFSIQRANYLKETFGAKDFDYITALGLQAILYNYMNQAAKAQALYREAYQSLKEQYGDEDLDAQFYLYQLAYESYFRNLGQPAQALPLLKRYVSLTEATLGKQTQEYLEAVNALGIVHRSLGLTQAVDENMAEIDAVLATWAKKDAIGAAWQRYGLASQAQSDNAPAISFAHYQKLVSYLEEHDATASTQYRLALLGSGKTLQDMQQYGLAQEYIKRSLEYLPKDIEQTDPLGYATQLANLAEIQAYTGEYGESEANYLKVLEIRERELGSDNMEWARTKGNLAFLYRKLGRRAEALVAYYQAAQVEMRYYRENPTAFLTTAKHLANTSKDIQFYEYARRILEDVRPEIERYSGRLSKDYAQITNDLALLYDRLGEEDLALRMLNEALEIDEQVLGRESSGYIAALQNIATQQWGMGLPGPALENMREAKRLHEQVYGTQGADYQTITMNLALICISQNMEEEGTQLLEDVVAFDMDRIQNFFPYMSEQEKGYFWLREASDDFEIYYSYAIYRQDRAPEMAANMYDYQLATKALLLNASNKIKENILNSNDSTLIRQLNEVTQMRELLAKLYSMTEEQALAAGFDRDSLETEINTRDKAIGQRSAAYGEQFTRPRWQEVRDKLQPNEAAVEVIRVVPWLFPDLAIADEQVFYVVLILRDTTSTYPEMILLQNGAAMEGRYLRMYQRNMQNKQPDSESYSIFWAPIAKALGPNVERVYFSPDGVFNQINLSTLAAPDGGYLLDEVDLRMVTNTRVLLSAADAPNPSNRALLFGYPDYALVADNPDKPQRTMDDLAQSDFDAVGTDVLSGLERFGFSELPGTKVEVETLQQQLQAAGWHTEVYLEEQANEWQLKQSNQPKVLHIATHGFFLTDVDGDSDEMVMGASSQESGSNPLLRSGLLMAGANSVITGEQQFTDRGENGILTAFEAMGLRLDSTDLVVLSACETGLGEVKNGEGVYGLQRALEVAGARNIIMALWRVNDQTTQELMTTFYRLWLESGNLRGAFIQAQHELKAKYEHPYYWGAFVLVGAPN